MCASGKPSELFPHWCGIEIHGEDWDGAADRAEYKAADAVATVSMQHILHTPGTFHLVEKVQSRLLEQLPAWKDIKPLVESTCVVFHHSFSRNKFNEGCLTGGHAIWRHMFLTGRGFGVSQLRS